MSRTQQEVTAFAGMGITFGEMVEPVRMASAPPQGPTPPTPPTPPSPPPSPPPTPDEPLGSRRVA